MSVRSRLGPVIIPHSLLLLTGFFVLPVVCAFAQRPPNSPLNLSNLRIDFISVGARPAAMGGAFIGAAQDETAGPINPAGLTYLRSVGVSLHQRRSRFRYKEPERSMNNEDAKRNFHSNNFDQNMVTVFVPFKKITVGIFRQVAFDSRFNFETVQFLSDNLQGRALTPREILGGLGNFPGRKVDLDLEMVSDGLSLAFQLSNRLSIGLTGKVSVLNFKLNEHTFLDPRLRDGQPPAGNSAETTYSITSVDERRTDQNFSVGLMGRLIADKLFLGAVYHFNPSFTLSSTTFLPEYTIESTNMMLAAQADEQRFRLSIPDTYGFGLYYIANNQLRFTFDLVRIQYSDLLSENDLNATADDVFDGQTQTYRDPDGRRDFAIDDATELHFGMEFLYKSPGLGLIPLRFGIFTNPDHRIYAAGSDPDLNRLYPKARSRTHYTFGLGIVLTNNLKFDGSINASNDGFELIGSTLISIPF